MDSKRTSKMQRMQKVRNRMLAFSRETYMARSLKDKSFHACSRRRVPTLLRPMRGLSMCESLSSQSTVNKQENWHCLGESQSLYHMWKMHNCLPRRNSTHTPNGEVCCNLRPVQRQPSMRKGLPRGRMECSQKGSKKRTCFQTLCAHPRGNNKRLSY